MMVGKTAPAQGIASDGTASAGFASRVRAAVVRTGTHLCVGIDPTVDDMPPWFRAEWESRGAGAFLETWAATVIDAATGISPAVKLQSAYFEAHGAAGFAALERAMSYARGRGLLTILDAKRGDISSTMAAYGAMAFEVMGADALTVTPYMGLDVVEPLLPWLRRGKGVYLVWVTSNPSGEAVQNCRVVGSPGAPGETTFAGHMLGLFRTGFRQASAVPALGLVAGATKVGRLPVELNGVLPDVSLLMPGVGAQGGIVTPELRALMANAASCLVPQSRSLSAWQAGATSWKAYGEQVRRRVEQAAAALTFAKS